MVSRKIHKSAVKRNRIRRRIYELVRARLPQLPVPTEMVITVYQAEVAEMSAEEITSAVDELLKKARLF